LLSKFVQRFIDKRNMPLTTSLFLLLVTFALRIACLEVEWQTLANITLAPRQEQTAAFSPPDSILIIGGITGDNAATTTNLVQRYCISRNTWDSLPPIPVALNHPNSAVVNGRLFVLGGLAQTPEAWSAVGDSWMYDEEQKVWTSIAPVPEPRGSAAVGVFDGKVILAGGLRQIQLVSPYEQDTVDTVSIYDTIKNEWSTVPANISTIPDTRDHACAAVVDRHFYILGGREQGQIHGKATVLVLDLDDLDAGWTIGPADIPTPRAGLSCGAVGGFRSV
jgi:N-acetylneuraminic acid mutarotase